MRLCSAWRTAARLAWYSLSSPGRALFFNSRIVLGPTSHWSPLAEAAFGTIMVAILAFGHLDTRASLLDYGLTRFSADLTQFLPIPSPYFGPALG
jgi:hypothetical protein